MVTTQISRGSNGNWELVRISPVGSRTPLQPGLASEQSILWLHPLAGLDFVRVAVVRHARSRRGPLLCQPPHLLLGYSRLFPEAPADPATGGFVRRVFYLRAADSELNMNQFPRDAVDPRTILPGVAGKPPRVAEWDRGYPRNMQRAALGLESLPSGTPVTAS